MVPLRLEPPVGSWGEDTIKLIDHLFPVWYRFRDRQVDCTGSQRQLAAIQTEQRALVEQGRDALSWEKARSFCRDLFRADPRCERS